MDIERIEDWIGREVVDADGNKLGKLDDVLFRGEEAVAGEVKPGLLSRKRLTVALAGASVTRDSVRVTGSYDGDVDNLETTEHRGKRLADIEAAETRAKEADAEAARRTVDAEDAAARAQEAEQAAADADEARRIAAARVERVKQREN